MRHLRNLSILVLVLLVGFGQSLYGQVLDQIPADALVVAKVSNLRQTSDKVSKLLNTLGVAQLAGIDDPLKTLKAEGKIEAGLNESGELALVIIDPEATGVADDKSVLLLVPVSDYAAFWGISPMPRPTGQLPMSISMARNPMSASGAAMRRSVRRAKLSRLSRRRS